MQLEYCVPGQDITVDNLGQTPFRAGIDQASCRVNNIGTFTIACSERDMDSGGLPAKATITPSFNSAVMIQGEHGGTLYESMVAGKEGPLLFSTVFFLLLSSKNSSYLLVLPYTFTN